MVSLRDCNSESCREYRSNSILCVAPSGWSDELCKKFSLNHCQKRLTGEHVEYTKAKHKRWALILQMITLIQLTVVTIKNSTEKYSTLSKDLLGSHCI